MTKKFNEKWVTTLLVVTLTLILTPILFYFFQFKNYGISSNPTAWESFANYLNSIVNSIVSIVTMIVTITIALYLKQMDDKRSENEISSSYLPHIVIEDDSFYTYLDKEFEPLKTLEYSSEWKGENYIPKSEQNAQYFLRLYNLGFGVAKNIEFHFYIDINEAVDEVIEINNIQKESEKLKISFQEFDTYYGITVGQYKPESKKVAYIMNQFTIERIPYLLNINNRNEPYFVRLPFSFIFLNDIYHYLFMKSFHLEKKSWNFPSLKLMIDYTDIGGNNYKKNFIIDIRLNSLSNNLRKLTLRELL